MIQTNMGYEILSKQQSEKYPEFSCALAYSKQTYEFCPYCYDPNIEKKGHGEQIIKDYDADENQLLMITFRRQRYECQNPACGKSFIVDEQLNGVHFTEDLKNYLSLKLIKDVSLSNKSLKDRYGISRETIAGFVKDYAKKLNPFFLPPKSSEALYICPFTYQQKEIFYLVSIDSKGNKALVAFFGYNDAYEELRTYLYYHKSYLEMIHLTAIMTDMNIELIKMLKSLYCNAEISIIPSLLVKRINSFDNDYGDGYYEQKFKALSSLKSLIKKNEFTLDKLKEWWDAVCLIPSVKSALTPLWNIIEQCQDELLRLPKVKNANISYIDKLIRKYNKPGVLFEVMAIRLLHTNLYEPIKNMETMYSELDIESDNGLTLIDAGSSMKQILWDITYTRGRLEKNENFTSEDTTHPMWTLPIMPSQEEIDYMKKFM